MNQIRTQAEINSLDASSVGQKKQKQPIIPGPPIEYGGGTWVRSVVK